MSNEALTRAQKAQITRQRKRLEELAYAADLEKQGKGTRATMARAMDNAVWRGAAPTGHARVPAYKNDSQVPTRRMANSSGTSSQSTKQRRRLPPDIVSSNSSDDDRPSQRPKRPRTTTVAEDLFENDSNVEVVSQAAHHKERSLGTQSAPKANKRASQVFDGDDADIEEDYEDHHGPGEEEDDDDAIAYSPTEDQDLVDIEPSQLRAKLCHELPHLEPKSGQSQSAEIDIPDAELEMTTTTEFEDLDQGDQEDHDDTATHSHTQDSETAANATASLRTPAIQKRGKASTGQRARMRRAEKPTFVTAPDLAAPDAAIRSHSTTALAPSDNSSVPTLDNDPNSPNYNWPAEAHYVPAPPSLPLSLKAQPLSLQQIMRTTIRLATGDFMFKTAYPSDKNHWKGLRSLLRRCATRLEFEKYAERFDKDVTFGEEVAQALIARIANSRGDVKVNASTCVAGYYSLLPGSECQDRVKDLTDTFMYIFPEEAGVLKRNKPFNHRCIITVIRKTFFEGGRGGNRSSLAEKHSKLFSSVFEEGPNKNELELPIPIVALAATAVHCALLEWETGEHKKLSFFGDTYQPVYERHVKVLEDIRNERGKYHRLMADLYKIVSRGKKLANVDTAALVDLSAMEE